MRTSTFITIKQRTSSVKDFLSLIAMYNIKYPSGYAYLIFDPINCIIKKYDSDWSNYTPFMSNLKESLCDSDIAIVTMKCSMEEKVSSNYRYMAQSYNAEKNIIDIRMPTVSVSNNVASDIAKQRKYFICNGKLLYKDEMLSAFHFIEKLTANNEINDFFANPTKFFTDKQVSLVKGSQVCIFDMSIESENDRDYFTFFNIENNNKFLILKNSIIINDYYPDVLFWAKQSTEKLKDVSALNLEISRISKAPLSLEEISQRQLFDHILEEFTSISLSVLNVTKSIKEILDDYKFANSKLWSDYEIT